MSCPNVSDKVYHYKFPTKKVIGSKDNDNNGEPTHNPLFTSYVNIRI